ncbi:MAG TPA: hypothetical protein VGU20_16720 [Stellaceae bacterium]|nr:hypothetical protein [Stellaceae bacterium]
MVEWVIVGLLAVIAVLLMLLLLAVNNTGETATRIAWLSQKTVKSLDEIRDSLSKIR